MKFQMKVEIKVAQATEKSGVSRTNKPYVIREQEGWAHTGKAYPERIVIRLGDAAQPYPVGVYVIDESCIYIGKYGSLEFGRIELKPLRQAA